MPTDLEIALKLRQALALSAGYDFADTLHNVFLDYGYPCHLTFNHFFNMYRRFGVAKRLVQVWPDYTWLQPPLIPEYQDFINKIGLWRKLRDLDIKQRLGRYAGFYMRVRDGRPPNEPIDTRKLSGPDSLISMLPLYESQLEVLSVEMDPLKDEFGFPKSYQVNTFTPEGAKYAPASFQVHPDRIFIASEDAFFSIWGVSCLEAPYNSLMDLRKIIGAGGEGYYRNAAQSVLFNLASPDFARENADLLDQFNTAFDDFTKNRMRRGLWVPGMEPTVLSSELKEPLNFFRAALNDIAAADGVPAELLIGSQTGRLAGDQDSIHFLVSVQSRRVNFGTDFVRSFFDWCQRFNIIKVVNYEVNWPDAQAPSHAERLAATAQLAGINRSSYDSGLTPVFTVEEMRENAGFPREGAPTEAQLREPSPISTSKQEQDPDED